MPRYIRGDWWGPHHPRCCLPVSAYAGNRGKPERNYFIPGMTGGIFTHHCQRFSSSPGCLNLLLISIFTVCQICIIRFLHGLGKNLMSLNNIAWYANTRSCDNLSLINTMRRMGACISLCGGEDSPA